MLLLLLLLLENVLPFSPSVAPKWTLSAMTQVENNTFSFNQSLPHFIHSVHLIPLHPLFLQTCLGATRQDFPQGLAHVAQFTIVIHSGSSYLLLRNFHFGYQYPFVHQFFKSSSTVSHSTVNLLMSARDVGG